jgi:hypothetical protein
MHLRRLPSSNGLVFTNRNFKWSGSRYLGQVTWDDSGTDRLSVAAHDRRRQDHGVEVIPRYVVEAQDFVG